MPSFFYMARDKQGTLQSGQLEAVDEDEVVAVLQNRGLFVTRLSRKDVLAGAARAAASRRRRHRQLHGRVTADDKVLFCQQLAALLEAGIPLLKSLEVVSAQVESRPLWLAIEQMRQDIEGGRTFRNALARHPKVFSNFWVNLVETGEASGHLVQSLNQLARYLESARDLQRKAVTAMTYPALLLGASVIGVGVFLVKVIPIFNRLFVSMHVELPLLTRLIITSSNVVRSNLFVIVVVLGAAGYVVRRFIQTDGGRWCVDRLLLRIPVFNQLFIQLQLAQFAQGLGTLLDSGVPILFSLEIMEHSLSNKLYAQAVGEIKEYVREGKPMAEPMERTGLFPPMTIQMVQVGEEIGELGKMLGRIATYYEERVATFVARLGLLLEPIAIAVMAVVIGVLVVSMFLPIFSMVGGFGVQQ